MAIDFTQNVAMVDLLSAGSLILSPTHLISDVKLLRQVNDDSTNLHLGSACCSKMDFQVQDLESAISSITRREFTYEKICEDTNTEYPKLNKHTVEVLNGSLLYTGDKALSIWAVEAGAATKKGQADRAPDQLPAIFVVENSTLYCLFPAAPYVNAYTISGTALVKKAIPALNDLQRSQVTRYCQRGVSMNIAPGAITYYTVRLTDGTPKALTESVWQRMKMGLFTAEKPVQVNDTKYKVSAYDRMAKFDVDVSTWVNARFYPITLRNLLSQLCSQCGVPLDAATFLNQDFTVKQNFASQNLVGRTVVQWVAEAAGGYAYITRAGSLSIKFYTASSCKYTAANIYSAQIADYTTDKVTKVQVKGTEKDVGVIVGTDGNAYVIESNPLLYANTDAQLRPAVTNIYNAIKALSYAPATISAFTDPTQDPGLIVSAKGTNTIIMTQEIAGNRVKLTSVGNQNFGVKAPSNVTTLALNQNTLEVSATVDGLEVKVEDVKENVTDLTITAEGLALKITNAENDITALELTTEGLMLATANNKLTFDRNGLTIYNGGFKIVNSSGTTTFSVDASTGNVSLTGSIRTSINADGRRFSVTPNGIYFYDGEAVVGNIYIEKPSEGHRSVISTDWLIIRNNSADPQSTSPTGRFYNQNGESFLEVDNLRAPQADIILTSKLQWEVLNVEGRNYRFLTGKI